MEIREYSKSLFILGAIFVSVAFGHEIASADDDINCYQINDWEARSACMRHDYNLDAYLRLAGEYQKFHPLGHRSYKSYKKTVDDDFSDVSSSDSSDSVETHSKAKRKVKAKVKVKKEAVKEVQTETKAAAQPDAVTKKKKTLFSAPAKPDVSPKLDTGSEKSTSFPAPEDKASETKAPPTPAPAETKTPDTTTKPESQPSPSTKTNDGVPAIYPPHPQDPKLSNKAFNEVAGIAVQEEKSLNGSQDSKVSDSKPETKGSNFDSAMKEAAKNPANIADPKKDDSTASKNSKVETKTAAKESRKVETEKKIAKKATNDCSKAKNYVKNYDELVNRGGKETLMNFLNVTSLEKGETIETKLNGWRRRPPQTFGEKMSQGIDVSLWGTEKARPSFFKIDSNGNFQTEMQGLQRITQMCVSDKKLVLKFRFHHESPDFNWDVTATTEKKGDKVYFTAKADHDASMMSSERKYGTVIAKGVVTSRTVIGGSAVASTNRQASAGGRQ